MRRVRIVRVCVCAVLLKRHIMVADNFTATTHAYTRNTEQTHGHQRYPLLSALLSDVIPFDGGLWLRTRTFLGRSGEGE